MLADVERFSRRSSHSRVVEHVDIPTWQATDSVEVFKPQTHTCSPAVQHDKCSGRRRVVSRLLGIGDMEVVDVSVLFDLCFADLGFSLSICFRKEGKHGQHLELCLFDAVGKKYCLNDSATLSGLALLGTLSSRRSG